MEAVNSTNSVVSDQKPALEIVYKYTVFNGVEEDPCLQTNDWNTVVNYLLSEDPIQEEGQKLYGRERETIWNDDECQAFIEANIRDLAHWTNYKIVEGDKS